MSKRFTESDIELDNAIEKKKQKDKEAQEESLRRMTNFPLNPPKGHVMKSLLEEVVEIIRSDSKLETVLVVRSGQITRRGHTGYWLSLLDFWHEEYKRTFCGYNDVSDEYTYDQIRVFLEAVQKEWQSKYNVFVMKITSPEERKHEVTIIKTL